MVDEDWIFPDAEGVVVDTANGRWSDGAFFGDEDIAVEWHQAEPAPHVQDCEVWSRWLEFLETSPTAAETLLIVAKSRARARASPRWGAERSSAAEFGAMMINLNQIVEHFLDEALRLCGDEGEKDEAVIRFLNDRNQGTDARRTEVLKWLHYYRVLQRLNEAECEAIASVVVDFADTRGAVVSPLTKAEIIERFNDLHSRCFSKVHPNKDGAPRSLTSLTSKALWCCYPDAIPMFDSHAQSALWVLSRVMGLARPVDTTEYGRFVSVWFSLYGGVERTLDDARLGDYRYKVRVFDRILWIIGQPDYGATWRQPTSLQ